MQKVTYCLRVNHTQYRYLENEIKKTHHMHAYFQKKIQKQPEINDSLLYKEMLSYQKKYMKMMHEQEVYAMWKQLKKQKMKEQQDTKAIYICRDVYKIFDGEEFPYIRFCMSNTIGKESPCFFIMKLLPVCYLSESIQFILLLVFKIRQKYKNMV